MRVLRSIQDLPRPLDYPVMAIGVFDGVHRGHREILKKIVCRARERNGTAVLLSFDPHPQKVISPGDAPPLLQTSRQRHEMLADLGVNILLYLPFTRQLSLLTPEEFAAQVLMRIGIREIHVGSNFRFGHQRTGDLKGLESLAGKFGFQVHRTEQIRFRGDRVSSTRIRHLITTGRVALAKRLLGRPYQIRGTVVQGARRGYELGFPTANLESENELAPATGVYISRARVDGQVFAAATNVGYRPTLYGDSEKTPTIESHLLDFSGNIYGKPLQLEFCFHFRRERKYANTDLLKQQIQLDLERSRKYTRRVQPFLEKS